MKVKRVWILLEDKFSYTSEMTTEFRVRLYGGRAKEKSLCWDSRTWDCAVADWDGCACASPFTTICTDYNNKTGQGRAVAEFISEPIMRTRTDGPEKPSYRSQLRTQTYNAVLLYIIIYKFTSSVKLWSSKDTLFKVRNDNGPFCFRSI